MNKNFKYYAGIWALFLAIFNIAVFLSPSETETMTKFGGAFWVGYIFITLAFVGQLLISLFAFSSKNMQKFFYKIPLIRISWSGLIWTLIFGTLCMIIPDLPNWIGIILCLVILCFNAISLVKAGAAADIVSEIDDKVKNQTFFIKSLTVDAESLISRAKSDETKVLTKKVYEAVRYSDPMSNDALLEIESEITLKLAAFSNAVESENDDVKALSDELLVLISDRNKKCKILK